MKPRWIAGHLLVVVGIAVLVNLGLWQLRRLDERRAANARVEARSHQPPVELEALPDDTTEAEFRRVSVNGTFDAANEVLVGFRTSKGLPGFHVVTPLVLADSVQEAVLVNRGFVPLELADRWPVPEAAPPPQRTTVVGLARRTRDGRPPVPSQTAAASTTPRTDQVDIDDIDELVPHDLAPVYLELQSPLPQGFPDPLPPLDLGDGPHKSYAFQWFAFAAVTAVGWTTLVTRLRRRRRPPRLARSGHAHDPPT